MSDPLRRELIAGSHTIVVKVGTNVLTDALGQLRRDRIESLSDQIHRVRQHGHRIVLVTSGAIGAGMGVLGLKSRPDDLAHLQACAAVGQCRLMQLYQDGLARHGIVSAQILLTAGDFDSRPRYLNTRNTIRSLLEFGALPIINENDTVSVAEIKFGDNDHLAAMVTNLLRAPLLILLTNVDGLYSDDPSTHADAELLPTVNRIEKSVFELAAATKSALGSGGMKSKLRAARLVTAAGEAVIMANGSVSGILDRIIAAEPVGTFFLPQGSGLRSWKRWLGFTARPVGVIRIDAGACRALVQGGKSLLPVGATAIEGEFRKGDLVSILDDTGHEIARGLSNYSSEVALKVRGKPTAEIASLLGNMPYSELVHRDNLGLIG
jgi:glutamate 5-kinase